MRLFLLLSILLTLAAESVRADTRLRLAAWGPPSAPINAAYADWARQINDLAKERGINFQIEVTWNSLGVGRQALNNLERGIADIAWTLPTMHPNRFSYLEELEAPNAPGDAQTASLDALEAFLLESESNSIVVPLAFVAIGPTFLHLRHRPDQGLSGMRIRVAGPSNTSTLKKAGAYPVQLAWTDIAPALRSSQLDGTISPWNGFTSISLQNATNFHSTQNFGFIFGMLATTTQTLSQLNEEERQLINSISARDLTSQLGKVSRDESARIEAEVLQSDGHSSFSLQK